MKSKAKVKRPLSEAAVAVLSAAKGVTARRKNKDVTLDELQARSPSYMTPNSVNKKALLLVEKGLLRKVTRGVYAVV